MEANMQILSKDNIDEINVLVSEFLISVKVDLKEDIPVEFLKYLREKGYKIQDGELLNELCIIIERKYML